MVGSTLLKIYIYMPGDDSETMSKWGIAFKILKKSLGAGMKVKN